jgi:DMSO/TMAO reductase YedYZ heme-binding membrane subunit
VLHYFWKVKLDTTYPVYYGILMGVLLTARLVQRARKMAAVPPRRAVPIRREA